MNSAGRLIMLGGPSCVGKGPLCQALKLFYPELENNLHKLVLYNSRDPRPGEIEGIDYYFRSRKEIEHFSNKDDFISLDVRGDLQGIDLREVQMILNQGGNVFFEGNPFVPRALWNLPDMSEVSMLRIFLSPLSRSEIIWLKERSNDISNLLIDIMRRKLLRRTKRQKTILSLLDLENIEKRANSAPSELQLAWQFDWVIPNHDGEDSENWTAFYYPIGDAHKALLAFAALLAGKPSPEAEKWEYGLWPND
jgi:guanylate kinase